MSELDDDLRPDETDLTGTWIIEDGRVTADVTQICRRITIIRDGRVTGQTPTIEQWRRKLRTQ
jgi:hypothetical protein